MSKKSPISIKDELKNSIKTPSEIEYRETRDSFVKFENILKRFTEVFLKLLIYTVILIVSFVLTYRIILLTFDGNFRFEITNEFSTYIIISAAVFLIIVGFYLIPIFYERFISKKEIADLKFEMVETPANDKTKIQPIELVGVRNDIALSLLWVEIQNELKRILLKSNSDNPFLKSTIDLPIRINTLKFNSKLKNKIEKFVYELESSINNKHFETDDTLSLIKKGSKVLKELEIL